MLFADQKTYLVELLMKQDQMSMATSLESRVPFLDHEFVEFSTRVPGHLKLRHGEGKYIVKKAVEDLLPRGDRLPQEDGIPHAAAAVVAGSAGGPPFRMLAARDGLLAAYLDRAAGGVSGGAAKGRPVRRHRPASGDC